MYHRYKYLGIVQHSGLVGAKPPPEAAEVLPHTRCVEIQGSYDPYLKTKSAGSVSRDCSLRSLCDVESARSGLHGSDNYPSSVVYGDVDHAVRYPLLLLFALDPKCVERGVVNQ